MRDGVLIDETLMPALSLPVPATDAATVGFEVTVHRDVNAVVEAWAALETSAHCSIYQTRAWLLPWTETLGERAGQKPVYALVTAPDRTPIALLCLGLHRRGPFRIATFLGGRDANINLPLTQPGRTWTRVSVQRLLRDVAHALGADAPDVFVLANQPEQWHGQSNPFALLPHQPSPSDAYETGLPASAEDLFAHKLSKETRKKLRKKEAKLAAIGPVTYRMAETAEDRAAVIDTFIGQKIVRFESRGIRSEFGTPEMRSFIQIASDGSPSTRPSIELHALYVGDRIVATYGGAAHDGQWSGMFNSFDTDETISKSSPADLLLMRVVAKACAEGATRLDLGIGAARYKSALCDETIPLFDCIAAASLFGQAYAAYARARQQAKRVIKRNPRLWFLVSRLRAKRTGA